MSVNSNTLPEGCPPLKSYYFYLTEGCNLACQHCWLAPMFQPHGNTGGHLSWELFVQAIEEGLPLGLSHVKLTGGEPLLHPDLLRMVDFLQKNGLSLTIETNGTLMTSEIANSLKLSGILNSISVSLDGSTAETHDAFRGVKGSFYRACQGIRYLTEVGIFPQVIMTIHKKNVEQIEELVHFAERLGASSVKLGIIQASGRGEMMFLRDEMLPLERLIELGYWIEKDLQTEVSIPIFYNWPPAFFNISKLIYSNGFHCNIFNILGILPNGKVALCGIGEQIPELCFGKLGEDSIMSIWRSHPVLIEIRQKIPNDFYGICKSCLLQSVCLGSCVAQNYKLSRDIKASYWFCEQAEQLGLFPSTRRRF